MNTTNRITLLRTNSDDPDFKGLVVLMDLDLKNRYGTTQSSYEIPDRLDTVLMAYCDQEAVGCGCFRLFSDNTIEIRRMFVKPAHRSQGIATQILNGLEKWAKERGFSHAILETGRKQPEAIHLYERSGYAITINYGPYLGMDNSICMRKKL